LAKELNLSVERQLVNDIDIVWEPFAPLKYPLSRMLHIYGPEFDIFPTFPMGGLKVRRYIEGHIFYTALADWNVRVHAGMGGMVWPVIAFPFPVDIEKFNKNNTVGVCRKIGANFSTPYNYSTPLQSPNPVRFDSNVGFLMIKRRSLRMADEIISFLTSIGAEFRIFTYGQYTEIDYLCHLEQSKWGVWLGKHESQGFAIEEALAMEVPLLVLDVMSMFDEGPWTTAHDRRPCTFCHLGPNAMLNATSVPYWSNASGEVVYSVESLKTYWGLFQHKVKLRLYDTRKVVLDFVSPSACAKRLMKLYLHHRNVWCEQYIHNREGKKSKTYYNMTFLSIDELIESVNK
jgi:hypothetical protein